MAEFFMLKSGIFISIDFLATEIIWPFREGGVHLYIWEIHFFQRSNPQPATRALSVASVGAESPKENDEFQERVPVEQNRWYVKVVVVVVVLEEGVRRESLGPYADWSSNSQCQIQINQS